MTNKLSHEVTKTKLDKSLAQSLRKSFSSKRKTPLTSKQILDQFKEKMNLKVHEKKSDDMAENLKKTYAKQTANKL